MSPNPADSGYIEVPERIAEFRQKHPDGSLQADVIKWPDNGFGFIVVRARCFRAPDDPRPGVGWAQEPFPGKTPFTKDSELQNAETSAWGRAIVAALAADTKRGIASKEEVQARRTDQVSGAVAEGGRGKTASRQEKAAPEMSGGENAGAAIDSSTPPPGSTSDGEEPTTGVDDSSPSDPATTEQLTKLKKKFGAVSALKKGNDAYGVSILTQLTQEQAKELLS